MPLRSELGLDAQASHRAADGDRLELRHDQRHQSVLQRRVDKILVGGHTAGDRCPGLRVDAEHPPECGHVQAGDGGSGAPASAAVNLNRFEVRLARRTGLPGGIAA